LTPKDPCSGRTAPLNSKRCILYIYSTNTGTEYFKHGIYCPFFLSLSLQNAVCFIILIYLVPVLFTFYIQGVLKLKKKSGAKRLSNLHGMLRKHVPQKLSCQYNKPHGVMTQLILKILIFNSVGTSGVILGHQMFQKFDFVLCLMDRASFGS